jgi:hypothetical protein
MSLETLKIVYYAYFNSVVNYGLIFWGNSSHSIKIFKIQKNIIILPLQSQYILSLLLFVVDNKNKL